MSGARHTPGPWLLELRASDAVVPVETVFVYAFGPTDDKKHGTNIAVVQPIGSFGWGEVASANANLIGAAPDLLEACEAGMRYFHAMASVQRAGVFERTKKGFIVEEDRLDDLAHVWFTATERAIARARGEP